MDFRPTRNTLIANYLITFGVMGFLCYLSIGQPARYYYSPEYTSHAYYKPGMESCRECHIKPFARFEEKTCYTGGCHSNFDPALGPVDSERLALNKDEKGAPRPQFGAIVGFHGLLGAKASCSECHPSHHKQEFGAFNNEVIRAEAQRRFANLAPGVERGSFDKIRADVFHDKSKLYTGRVSCQSCHLNLPASSATAK